MTAERVLLALGTSTGGVGRHVRELAAGLAACGVDVAVAAPAGTGDRFGYADVARFAAVEIAERPRPRADLRAVLRLRRLAGGAHVVHAHGLRAGALAVLAVRGRAGRPAVVVTLHNAPVPGSPATSAFAAASRGLERIVARGADEVLVVSADLGERIRALGARRVERALIPAPPGDPPRLDPAAVRAGLGVPGGTALLVTIARLAPQKGLGVLADALDRLRATRPRLAVCAVVAGEGPMAAALRADAEARGLPLRLFGGRDDVADLLAAADLVVVPSRWEGQSLAVQEALRSGAAIVATDAGGTADLVGDAAVLVPPGDPAALAVAIGDLLDDPERRDTLRDRARRRAAALPTAADALDQVRGVYARLQADRPRTAR